MSDAQQTPLEVVKEAREAIIGVLTILLFLGFNLAIGLQQGLKLGHSWFWNIVGIAGYLVGAVVIGGIAVLLGRYSRAALTRPRSRLW